MVGLLFCEMMAGEGNLWRSNWTSCLSKLVPSARNGRIRLTAEVRDKFTGKLQSEPREFFGRKVGEVVRKNGLELVFGDGSWMCYRVSDTEPAVGVYPEAANAAELARLSG